MGRLFAKCTSQRFSPALIPREEGLCFFDSLHQTHVAHMGRMKLNILVSFCTYPHLPSMFFIYLQHFINCIIIRIDIMFINLSFSLSYLVYIVLLLLERGPALECKQATRPHITKENWVSLFPPLSNPNISSARGGIPCTYPLPHTGIPFRLSLGRSLACCHNLVSLGCLLCPAVSGKYCFFDVILHLSYSSLYE